MTKRKRSADDLVLKPADGINNFKLADDSGGSPRFGNFGQANAFDIQRDAQQNQLLQVGKRPYLGAAGHRIV